jgi:hypothetical protein
LVEAGPWDFGDLHGFLEGLAKTHLHAFAVLVNQFVDE